MKKRKSINLKYERRSKRLFNTMDSNKDVVLVRYVKPTTPNQIIKKRETGRQLKRLLSLVQKKYNSNITLLVIDHQHIIKMRKVPPAMIILHSLEEFKKYITKYMTNYINKK
jgi:hypothetical protein